ncbi:MAG: hypothetical protein AABX63_02050 [Nanoarchaeota archaeon]
MDQSESKPSDMTTFEIIQALKCLQNDFNKLRTDWAEARENLNEKFADILDLNRETKTRLKAMEGKTALDFKALMRAKALGINPKSLLSSSTTMNDGEETKKE